MWGPLVFGMIMGTRREGLTFQYRASVTWYGFRSPDRRVMPEVSTTTTVNAGPEEVWALLRDFNGLGTWHPAMSLSMIEEGRGAEEVGAIRRFTYSDGSIVRERLTAFSDADRSYSYTVEEIALPVSDYRATLAVSPATTGGAVIDWSVSFVCPPEMERELEDFLRNVVFGSGMVVLAARFQ
jgi:hypothetical protein